MILTDSHQWSASHACNESSSFARHRQGSQANMQEPQLCSPKTQRNLQITNNIAQRQHQLITKTFKVLDTLRLCLACSGQEVHSRDALTVECCKVVLYVPRGTQPSRQGWRVFDSGTRCMLASRSCPKCDDNYVCLSDDHRSTACEAKMYNQRCNPRTRYCTQKFIGMKFHVA